MAGSRFLRDRHKPEMARKNTRGGAPGAGSEPAHPLMTPRVVPGIAFGRCAIRAGRQGSGARPTQVRQGKALALPGAGAKEEPSSRHANGDGVWDFGAQKASKPPDTHFVLGIRWPQARPPSDKGFLPKTRKTCPAPGEKWPKPAPSRPARGRLWNAARPKPARPRLVGGSPHLGCSSPNSPEGWR